MGIIQNDYDNRSRALEPLSPPWQSTVHVAARETQPRRKEGMTDQGCAWQRSREYLLIHLNSAATSAELDSLDIGHSLTLRHNTALSSDIVEYDGIDTSLPLQRNIPLVIVLIAPREQHNVLLLNLVNQAQVLEQGSRAGNDAQESLRLCEHECLFDRVTSHVLQDVDVTTVGQEEDGIPGLLQATQRTNVWIEARQDDSSTAGMIENHLQYRIDKEVHVKERDLLCRGLRILEFNVEADV